MTENELVQIAAEIRDKLVGRRFGKLYSLGKAAVAIDFHPHAGAYLFIDVSPRYRSVYLIVRKLKVIERMATAPNAFQIRLRKELAGFELVDAMPDKSGVVLILRESDERQLKLVAAVNDDPARLMIADNSDLVVDASRLDAVGSLHVPRKISVTGQFDGARIVQDLSPIFDAKRLEAEASERFAAIAIAVRKAVKNEILKRSRLLMNLDADLVKHGDAEKWKRYGDLLLASLSNLSKQGDNYSLIDFFDPDQPTILIPNRGEESPKATAEKYYKNYRKAANAIAAIANRKRAIEAELAELENRRTRIETAIESNDIEVLEAFTKRREPVVEKAKKDKNVPELKGVRRFASSNGFEILVGKKASDNDSLTFRIAKSLDTWLHAADYPGSHVILRNPNRKDIPPQTLIEAASIAAFYSDARDLPKAAVNYTQRKFVNKPRGAAPGLVRLAGFKTLMVKPEVPFSVTRIEV